MIFPGMDPYLEHPHFWPGVHAKLLVYIAERLQPLLLPRYVAAVEERVYVEGADRSTIPDVQVQQIQASAPRSGGAAAVAVLDEPIIVRVPLNEVREPYIEILDLSARSRVVTLIEAVSPSNKQPGPGRDAYLSKQREILASDVHLVEIDLLREGRHVLAVAEWKARERDDYDYLVCVNRAREPRNEFELYPRTIRDRLPNIRIPLAAGDADVRFDLQEAFDQTWTAGAYRLRVNYSAPCVPALAPDDQAWADGMIQRAGAGA